MGHKATYEELTEKLRHMEAEMAQNRQSLEQIVSQATKDLQEKNLALQKEINERKRAEASLIESREQLEISREELEKSNRCLEEAIFKTNQIAADAEIRNYHLESEIERRKQTEALLRESEIKYRSIIENIEDGYCEMDAAWNINFFNDSLCKIFNLPAAEVSGLNWSSILPQEDVEKVFTTFSATYVSDKPRSGFRAKIITSENAAKHIELSLTPMSSSSGQKIGLRCIVRDVGKQTQYEEKLIYLAYHDALTGLNNRKAFYERLDQALNRARRYETEIGLLYVDIDRFKQVNDSFGHQAGDALLREITRRLIACLRITDFISRIGGDEFTVIMDNPQQLTPKTAAERIMEALQQPYDILGNRIDFIAASVGIAIFPADASDADGLISKADTAMYRAKEKRNGVSV